MSKKASKMVSLLKQYKITDKVAWKQFLLHNHPDKGGNSEVFISVKNAYEKYGPQPDLIFCFTNPEYENLLKRMQEHLEKSKKLYN